PLFSRARGRSGVTGGAGRFLSREGSNLWVKTAEGRQGLPVDPEVPLARRVGDVYYPSSSLTLRPGDRLRWFRNGAHVLAAWVEMDQAGPPFEAESCWRDWGHGVGLCQNGAVGMALAGQTYDRILKHYYTGIDIVQASSVTVSAPPSTR